jgi:periplasmic divalent cation tolerance protein
MMIRGRTNPHLRPVAQFSNGSGIEDRPEAHVALHTRASLVSAVVDQTNARHPYVVPCVVATTIVAANPAYRQWILDQTQKPTGEHP